MTKQAIHNFFMQCYHDSQDAGWWNDPETGEDLMDNPFIVPTKLMLTVSELSEGMEGYRKGLKDDKLRHRDMLEVELADAVIRIADLAGKLGYNLTDTIYEKRAYNKVRVDHSLVARRSIEGKKF